MIEEREKIVRKKIFAFLIVSFLVFSFISFVFASDAGTSKGAVEGTGKDEPVGNRFCEKLKIEQENEFCKIISKNAGVVIGIFTSILKKSTNQVNDITKGLFGGTITDAFLWLLGAKRSWQDRLWDIGIGAAAWILIWVIYLIELKRLKKYWKEYSEKEIDIKRVREKWLYKLAYPWWKIFIFIGIYWGFMQLPIINWVLRLITFYSFTPIWLKPIILALEVGYLPTIAELLAEIKEKHEEEKRKIEARVAAQTLKDLGRV